MLSRLSEENQAIYARVQKEEADKRSCEAMLKELQMRLEEAEVNAIRGGRKAIEKLEARLMHLNAELDMEQKLKSDLAKNCKKAERRWKEMEFHYQEEKKTSTRLQVQHKFHARVGILLKITKISFSFWTSSYSKFPITKFLNSSPISHLCYSRSGKCGLFFIGKIPKRSIPRM